MVGADRGQTTPVTDVATGLGGTASCPQCGAQVTVPEGGGASVPCPKCGAAVSAPPGGPPDVQGDLTLDEVLRGYGANGYDAEMSVAGPDSVLCGSCQTATAPG